MPVYNADELEAKIDSCRFARNWDGVVKFIEKYAHVFAVGVAMSSRQHADINNIRAYYWTVMAEIMIERKCDYLKAFGCVKKSSEIAPDYPDWRILLVRILLDQISVGGSTRKESYLSSSTSMSSEDEEASTNTESINICDQFSFSEPTDFDAEVLLEDVFRAISPYEKMLLMSILSNTNSIQRNAILAAMNILPLSTCVSVCRELISYSNDINNNEEVCVPKKNGCRKSRNKSIVSDTGSVGSSKAADQSKFHDLLLYRWMLLLCNYILKPISVNEVLSKFFEGKLTEYRLWILVDAVYGRAVVLELVGHIRGSRDLLKNLFNCVVTPGTNHSSAVVPTVCLNIGALAACKIPLLEFQLQMYSESVESLKKCLAETFRLKEYLGKPLLIGLQVEYSSLLLLNTIAKSKNSKEAVGETEDLKSALLLLESARENISTFYNSEIMPALRRASETAGDMKVSRRGAIKSSAITTMPWDIVVSPLSLQSRLPDTSTNPYWLQITTCSRFQSANNRCFTYSINSAGLWTSFSALLIGLLMSCVRCKLLGNVDENLQPFEPLEWGLGFVSVTRYNESSGIDLSSTYLTGLWSLCTGYVMSTGVKYAGSNHSQSLSAILSLCEQCQSIMTKNFLRNSFCVDDEGVDEPSAVFRLVSCRNSCLNEELTQFVSTEDIELIDDDKVRVDPISNDNWSVYSLSDILSWLWAEYVEEIPLSAPISRVVNILLSRSAEGFLFERIGGGGSGILSKRLSTREIRIVEANDDRLDKDGRFTVHEVALTHVYHALYTIFDSLRYVNGNPVTKSLYASIMDITGSLFVVSGNSARSDQVPLTQDLSARDNNAVSEVIATTDEVLEAKYTNISYFTRLTNKFLSSFGMDDDATVLDKSVSGDSSVVIDTNASKEETQENRKFINDLQLLNSIFASFSHVSTYVGESNADLELANSSMNSRILAITLSSYLFLLGQIHSSWARNLATRPTGLVRKGYMRENAAQLECSKTYNRIISHRIVALRCFKLLSNLDLHAVNTGSAYKVYLNMRHPRLYLAQAVLLAEIGDSASAIAVIEDCMWNSPCGFNSLKCNSNTQETFLQLNHLYSLLRCVHPEVNHSNAGTTKLDSSNICCSIVSATLKDTKLNASIIKGSEGNMRGIQIVNVLITLITSEINNAQNCSSTASAESLREKYLCVLGVCEVWLCRLMVCSDSWAISGRNINTDVETVKNLLSECEAESDMFLGNNKKSAVDDEVPYSCEYSSSLGTHSDIVVINKRVIVMLLVDICHLYLLLKDCDSTRRCLEFCWAVLYSGEDSIGLSTLSLVSDKGVHEPLHPCAVPPSKVLNLSEPEQIEYMRDRVPTLFGWRVVNASGHKNINGSGVSYLSDLEADVLYLGAQLISVECMRSVVQISIKDRNARCKEIYDIILLIHPNHIPTLLALSELYLDSYLKGESCENTLQYDRIVGVHDEAISFPEKAVSMYPEIESLLFRALGAIAPVSMKEGVLRPHAIDSLDAAYLCSYGGDSYSFDAFYLLGRYCEALGMPVRAAEYYATALEYQRSSGISRRYYTVLI